MHPLYFVKTTNTLPPTNQGDDGHGFKSRHFIFQTALTLYLAPSSMFCLSLQSELILVINIQKKRGSNGP